MSLSDTELLLTFAGAGDSRQSDPLMDALRPYWEQAGLKVGYIHLDPSHSEEALVETFCRNVESASLCPNFVIGGFSLGARVATLSAVRLQPLALVCLGYPFHRRGAPEDRRGLRLLQDLTSPTLVLQGSRDSHGNRQEVKGYEPLRSNLEVHWLEDANHRYQPRLRSGLTEAEHFREVASTTVDFIKRILLSSADD